MTEVLTLPHLELADHVSDFDETVLIIDGHEEETITIECPNSRELAERLVQLVNEVRRLQGLPPSDQSQVPCRAIDC